MTLCYTKTSLLPLFLIIIIIILSLPTGITSSPTIGVTYTHPSASPEQVAATLQRLNITSVRLLNPDPALIRAFTYSSISLLLSIPNSDIPSLAANRSNAAAWLYSHVIPFYPRARISAISVGADVLSTRSDLADAVLAAVKNVHVTLHELGIRHISVSTTFSLLSVLTAAFPPSAAEFQEPINQVLISPLLDFLEEANSSFLINIHPYRLYRVDSEIPVGYALFQEGDFNFRDDLTTGVRYTNLFDTMVDAVLSAMAVAGHENIPVIVTETGWPSAPGPDAGEEVDAHQVYAEMFLRGLIKHLKSGYGTPLKKDGVSEVYIFELFDGIINHTSSGLVRQWGILYPNMTSKFKIDFNGSSRNGAVWEDFWVRVLMVLGHGTVLIFDLLF